MRTPSPSSPPPPPPAADDLPRSRFDLREEPTGRPLTSLAFGVVLANAFMMLKDVLYAKPRATPGPAEGVAGTAGTDLAPEPEIAGTATPATARPDATDASPSDGLEPAQPVKFHVSSGRTVTFEHADSIVSSKFGPGGFLKPLPIIAGNDNGAVASLPTAALLRALATGGGAGEGSLGPTTAPAAVAAIAEDPVDYQLAPDDDDDTRDPDDQPDPDASGDPDGARANRAPTVSNSVFLYDIFIGQSVLIGLLQLLRTASDPDGDALDVRNVSVSWGGLTEVEPGLWRFTAEPERLGEVTFSYEVTDGIASVAQTALLRVVQVPGETIVGTAGPDTLLGSAGNDIIEGRDGDDDLVGREGADVLDGGAGNDRIVGGAGADVIYGGAGNDVLIAGDGDDTIYGGDGDDVILAGDGADLVFAGAGDDTVEDGGGADAVDLGEGNDLLIVADDGTADVFDGGTGADTISFASIGGGRRVEIDLEEGTARIAPVDGGATADPSDSAPAAIAIVDDGGEETSAVETGVLETAGGPQDVAPAADTIHDLVTGFENVVGSSEGDRIIGDGHANVIDAGHGDDVVAAAGGDDTVVTDFGDGSDTLDGGEGYDTLDASEVGVSIVIDLEAGTISASNSTDGGEVDTISNFEAIVAGHGNDTIIAGFGQEDFWGGAGEDIFVFRATASSGKGSGSRDRILDYSVGDRVDLDGIITEFAPAELAGAIEDENIKKFILIRDGEEFSRPGQLKIAYEELESGTVAVLQGTIDWDATADFEIEIHGLTRDSLTF